VVGLKPTHDVNGTTAGLVLWYHVGSSQYQRRSRIKVIIKIPPARCV
jgi:hypothetical protein